MILQSLTIRGGARKELDSSSPPLDSEGMAYTAEMAARIR